MRKKKKTTNSRTRNLEICRCEKMQPSYQEGKQICGDYYIVSVFDVSDESKIRFSAYSLESGATFTMDTLYSEFDLLFRYNSKLLTPHNSDARYQWAVDHLSLDAKEQLCFVPEATSEIASHPEKVVEQVVKNTESAKQRYIKALYDRLSNEQARAVQILRNLDKDVKPVISAQTENVPIFQLPKTQLAVSRLIPEKKILKPIKVEEQNEPVPINTDRPVPQPEPESQLIGTVVPREDRREELKIRGLIEVEKRNAALAQIAQQEEIRKTWKLQHLAKLRDAATLRVQAKREKEMHNWNLNQRRTHQEVLRDRLRRQIGVEWAMKVKAVGAAKEKDFCNKIKIAKGKKISEIQAALKRKYAEKRKIEKLEKKREEKPDAVQSPVKQEPKSVSSETVSLSREQLEKRREERIAERERKRTENLIARIKSLPVGLAIPSLF